LAFPHIYKQFKKYTIASIFIIEQIQRIILGRKNGQSRW